LDTWSESNKATLDKWRDAVANAQNFAVREVLLQADRKIFLNFVEPPNRAVDTLSGAMRSMYNTKRKTSGDNTMFTKTTELRELETRSWETLKYQWDCQFAGSQSCPGRADSLFTALASGGIAGSAFAKLNGTVNQRLIGREIGKSLEIWHADALTGQRENLARRLPSYEPVDEPYYTQEDGISRLNKTWSQVYLLPPWVESDSGVTVASPNIYRREVNVGGYGGKCVCPNGEIYEVGDYKNNCERLACEGGTWTECRAGGINSANEGMKVTCGALPILNTNSTSRLAISRTVPIVFDQAWGGVVVADMSLQRISDILVERWYALSINLEQNWDYAITSETSNIFIVSQVSLRYPEQEGLLLGTSEEGWFTASGNSFTNASESSVPIIADASKAILLIHESWSAESLLQTSATVFYVSMSAIRNGTLKTCDPLDKDNTDLRDCVQIATHSMSLDEDVRWLIVVVLPSEAYFKTYNDQVEKTSSGIKAAQESTSSTLGTTNAVCILIIVFATAIALLMAFATSVLVLGPLSRLGFLMNRLGNLDFARNSPEYLKLQKGVGGHVREINVLREGFCRLSQSIETFAKFVPETVVRELVSGDHQKRQRAAQLNVTRRVVTIMFSDVANFTTIAESLSHKQLLFMLTLYLTVMTRIIEAFEGVVGEIVGDGLLCFWNTPNNVEDHAVKACMAALAQQQALGPLNAELRKRNLPELNIRIGLHTGEVLTGNIGSERKMKFGCMGDPVNLASRLEGLCKVYGVGIMCSGATHDLLPEELGFVTRRLDLVQVKGKKEPTLIYDVVGREGPVPEWHLEAVPQQRIAQARLYEQALDAYQKADFTQSVKCAEKLCEQCPNEVAANKLLERARGYESKVKGGFWEFLKGGSGSPISAEDLTQWTGVEKMTDK
jgi:class 3 adenylate cyclase